MELFGAFGIFKVDVFFELEMTIPYVQAMVLAAVSDGEIQKEELTVIHSYLNNLPALEQLSDGEFSAAVADTYNKVSAGMKVEHIVEHIGENLDAEQRNVAYALAVEICHANFSYVPSEKDYIYVLEETWKISPDVIDMVKGSCKLRYGIE